MTADQIPDFLKWIYAFGFILVFILLVAAFITRNRTGRYHKAWAPLLRVVNGTVKSQRRTSTLSGDYRGHPVGARISKGGRNVPDKFSVEVPAGQGGRDWELAHRSEKLLGPESWRVFTKDPALQAKMEAAGVPTTLKDWPEHTAVRYDAAKGTLTLTEEIFSPQPGHFKSQLDLLDWLAEVNRQLNG